MCVVGVGGGGGGVQVWRVVDSVMLLLYIFPPQVGLIAARRTGRLRGGKSVAKDED